MKFFPFSKKKAEIDLSSDDVRTMLVSIGQIIGKFAREELREGARRYDVVWKDTHYAPRISHVFYLQDKESLESGLLEPGLVNLQFAVGTHRAKPFLVIYNEQDTTEAEEYFRPHIVASFPEIGDSTVILSGYDVYQLYQSLVPFTDLMGQLLTD